MRVHQLFLFCDDGLLDAWCATGPDVPCAADEEDAGFALGENGERLAKGEVCI